MSCCVRLPVPLAVPSASCPSVGTHAGCLQPIVCRRAKQCICRSTHHDFTLQLSPLKLLIGAKACRLAIASHAGNPEQRMNCLQMVSPLPSPSRRCAVCCSSCHLMRTHCRVQVPSASASTASWWVGSLLHHRFNLQLVLWEACPQQTCPTCVVCTGARLISGLMASQAAKVMAVLWGAQMHAL